FHKYMVTSVTDDDLTGASPAQVTSYAYAADGSNDYALWAHHVVDRADIPKTSWAQWRGYPTVTTTKGTVAGQQTVTRTLYHRGLLGDAKKSGDDTQVLFNQRQTFTTGALQAGAAIPVALAGGGNGNSLCLDI